MKNKVHTEGCVDRDGKNKLEVKAGTQGNYCSQVNGLGVGQERPGTTDNLCCQKQPLQGRDDKGQVC